jgi:DNA repair protein RadC
MPEDIRTDLKSLLAHSLREKPDSYIIDEIFNRYPTPSDLVDVTEQELIGIKGIGKVKSRQIVAALKLALTLAKPIQQMHPNIIRSSQDVYKLLESEFRYLKKEHFVCIFLNTKNCVIATETISIGSLNASIVHPREVFRAAIKRCSASIICAHNHPSGNPDPSPEDIEITERLVSAGIIIGIEVLDHVIFGHDRYTSLKERGLMKI